MTRMSKQGKRRATSPRRPKLPGVKTGKGKDNLAKGYKEHANAATGELAKTRYIPKMK